MVPIIRQSHTGSCRAAVAGQAPDGLLCFGGGCYDGGGESEDVEVAVL